MGTKLKIIPCSKTEVHLADLLNEEHWPHFFITNLPDPLKSSESLGAKCSNSTHIPTRILVHNYITCYAGKIRKDGQR